MEKRIIDNLLKTTTSLITDIENNPNQTLNGNQVLKNSIERVKNQLRNQEGEKAMNTIDEIEKLLKSQVEDQAEGMDQELISLFGKLQDELEKIPVNEQSDE